MVRENEIRPAEVTVDYERVEVIYWLHLSRRDLVRQSPEHRPDIVAARVGPFSSGKPSRSPNIPAEDAGLYNPGPVGPHRGLVDVDPVIAGIDEQDTVPHVCRHASGLPRRKAKRVVAGEGAIVVPVQWREPQSSRCRPRGASGAQG
jgi:hypothetical protein